MPDRSTPNLALVGKVVLFPRFFWCFNIFVVFLTPHLASPTTTNQFLITTFSIGGPKSIADACVGEGRRSPVQVLGGDQRLRQRVREPDAQHEGPDHLCAQQRGVERSQFE